jgi:acetyl-CoA carboxylase carboxyltransferase component
MGGAQAAGTLVDLRAQQIEKGGKKLSKKELDALRADVEARYAAALDPRYAAARLWCDRILEPARTRDALVLALEVAALGPEIPELRTGVYPS